MIDYFRSLFGLSGSGRRRTVLGHSVDIEIKDVKYIQSSKQRLDALFNIYNRFKNTSHAPRVKAVYDKSKVIHTYLVARNRLHELELFHIQHTEHFINAFTAILDAHQQKFEIAEAHEIPTATKESQEPSRESALETLLNHFKAEKFQENWNELSGKQDHNYGRTTRRAAPTAEVETLSPSLSIPTVSINTFEKTPYFPEGLPARAIGYTSSSQEKFEFQQHLIHKLGIENIKYMGNSLVQMPGSNDSYPTGLVPIIHWSGFLYAVSLSDYRLFPVKTFRKGS